MKPLALIAAIVLIAANVTVSEGKDMKSFKKPDKDELRKRLTPIQYEVTQEEGTERPFANEYWNEKREGIYVDIVSGEPLFSSAAKYDSKTGWPSFWQPLVKNNIVEKEDRKLFSVRTEVRSQHANSHLGHVFDDGPAPTGLRYCMNSAAMKFIPKENLVKEGYGEFASLFASSSTASAKNTKTARAIFAGGCFWCMEPPFDKLADSGVISTIAGYTGGRAPNPTYEQVCSGESGHREAIEITYDPSRIGYDALLAVFWKNIDPLDPAGQFCDKGDQYTSAIYYLDAEQKRQAEKSLELSKDKIRQKGKIVTQILPALPFYAAEDYHQDYYVKNPVRYKYYRFSCGRDNRLKALWE